MSLDSRELKMDANVTQILVCPICKGPLFWDKTKKEFFCRSDLKAFPVIDGIPDMVPEEARDLREEELEGKEK